MLDPGRDVTTSDADNGATPNCCAALPAPLHLHLNPRAMEFAKTVLLQLHETDDSWMPRCTRSFFLDRRGVGLETPCVCY